MHAANFGEHRASEWGRAGNLFDERNYQANDRFVVTHEQQLSETDSQEEQFQITTHAEIADDQPKSALEKHLGYSNQINNDLPLQYYQEKAKAERVANSDRSDDWKLT